jgi:2-polyprenyl-3-methyl-5-hydroxy-6-metoxy-1,4-benzoquinol methylase
VCGADDPVVVYEARRDHAAEDLIQKFRASGDELLIDRLVQCRQCSFRYITPRLRGDVILSSYAEGDDPAYVSQLAARERTFDRSLDEIERLAGRKGRLLDVGTAAGAFVAVARSRGWEVEACEPNRWLAEWGRQHYGIPIRVGTVFDQDYERASFDVVTLWDVIEHTPDPRALLDCCRDLLKPGGVLIVNYPDAGSWIARLLGRRWPFLTSVHLSYFDRRTMCRLLADTGFRVELVRPHVQWLEADYVLQRGSIVSPGMSRAMRALLRPASLARSHIPYWLGQTFIAARRSIPLLAPLIPDIVPLL